MGGGRLRPARATVAVARVRMRKGFDAWGRLIQRVLGGVRSECLEAFEGEGILEVFEAVLGGGVWGRRGAPMPAAYSTRISLGM
eukprot:1725673-Prymnesium_polylepis.1